MINYRRTFQLDAKAACGEIKDCVILNWPDYNNAGDHMISLGVFHLLAQNMGVNIRHIASMRTINFSDVKSSSTVVFVGGGCFGDLYPWNIDSWCDVLDNCRGKNIVIFPVSAHFDDPVRLKRAKDTFARYGKNLSLMLRDKSSLTFCEKHFEHNRLSLVPDAAFELMRLADDMRWMHWGGAAFLSRGEDREAKKRDENPVVKEFDFKSKRANWDSKPWVLWELIKKRCRWNYYYPMLSLAMFQDAVRQFARFDYIHTDRLHGHILAEMLQIRHEIWNDKFNKILNFHRTWTSESQWVAEVHE